MIESDFLKSPYAEILKGVPLLQSGELVKAEDITGPENLSEEKLLPLWQLGKGFLQANPNFVAVAFSQFQDRTIQIAGGDTSLRKIIFFPEIQPRDSHGNYLLINPRIYVSAFSDYNFLVEGCGSINFAKLGMVVKRPDLVLLETYAWKPNEEIFQTQILLYNNEAGLTQHEYIHLDGEDATFYPENILDFTNPKDEGWGKNLEIQEMISEKIKEKEPGSGFENYEAWLIHKGEKLTVVDNFGNYMKDFER